MQQRCHKEQIFQTRIQEALGVKMEPYTCSIVDQKEMTNVMGRAGWNKSQTRGVVGFHLDDKVYVLKGANWTTLHELIHRAGVNSDRVNRFLAEGLTELIASDLKESPDEHQPTYPAERRWVEDLLDKLNMTPLELGRIIAKSRKPHEEVADLILSKGITQKSRRELIKSLKPQVPNAPSLNRVHDCSCGVTYEGSSNNQGFGTFGILGAIFVSISLATIIKRRQENARPF